MHLNVSALGHCQVSCYSTHRKEEPPDSVQVHREPGACVSSVKGRFQLEFPDTWNSRLPGLFWGRQKVCGGSGDTTRPGWCFKSAALVQCSFLPWWYQNTRRLSNSKIAGLSEHFRLRAGILTSWPPCQWHKEPWGERGISSNFCASILKEELIPDRGKK